MMTRDEFEQGYAERSGCTVEWLHLHDRWAVPCDCGEAGCEGWQMVRLEPLVGDGITDDTAAIQQRIDLFGGRFPLPSGNFRLTRTLELPSGGGLYGLGIDATVLEADAN